MWHALVRWWHRPCVVQDLRQALCRHCWHVDDDGERAFDVRCCWCGTRFDFGHGPFAEVA